MPDYIARQVIRKTGEHDEKADNLGAALMLITTGAMADHGSKQHSHGAQQGGFEYGRVIDARPIYREVEVSSPVQECYEVPVYHTSGSTSRPAACSRAVLIGGIIGHQIGKRQRQENRHRGRHPGRCPDRPRRGQRSSRPRFTQVVEYRKHCETHHRVSYEQVVDGYDVTYKYRGKRYHVRMPYDPGKRIKLRIEFHPYSETRDGSE